MLTEGMKTSQLSICSNATLLEYVLYCGNLLSNMIPNLSIIGNVSKSTGILILNGENDSQTPVQQAFLLQQKLTECKSS